MNEFTVIDFLGFRWVLAKHKFERQANGYWKMWAWVMKGPPLLRDFQEIPFPVFTDWWTGCDECGGPRQHSGNPPGCGE